MIDYNRSVCRFDCETRCCARRQPLRRVTLGQDEFVSCDFIIDPRPSIFDAGAGMLGIALSPMFVKVVSQMVDLAHFLANRDNNLV